MPRKSQKRFLGLPERDVDQILQKPEADWERLRGKRLFVTGGTGFFGKWLTGALAGANERLRLELDVTVLSRDPRRFLDQFPELKSAPGFHFEPGHVADVTPDCRIYDFIIHAATDSIVFTTSAEEEERSRAIVAGTRRMLDLAETSGARLLNISSGAVYGAAAGKKSGASEDDYAMAQPLTPYAKAKREAEQLCADSGLDFVTARAFAFLGPYLPLDAHFAAGNFLRDALAGGPVLVRGDGTALRSYLHPADLVVWLLRLLVRGERGRAYNVGSDEAVTTAQLARLIADAAGPEIEVTIQSLQPQGPQNIYLPNITRARTELQLEVALPLREAIARTIAFLRAEV